MITSRIKRFITDESFETVTGSIYQIRQKAVQVHSGISRFKRFAPKIEIGDFDTLKTFVLGDEDGITIISQTVDVEEAKKWLASNKPVVVFAATGECIKQKFDDGHCRVIKPFTMHRIVSQIEKISNEIVVTATSGEILHLDKISLNNSIL